MTDPKTRALELEEAGQELRDVTREAEWPRACRAWDRAKKATGPITDPTQWAGTVGRHFVSTRELDHMEIAVADAEGLLDVGEDGKGIVPREFLERCLRARKKTEKPSCVPADCQHFEKLPSGLWAWVQHDEDGFVVVEPDWVIHPEDGSYECGMSPEFRVTVDHADFLAARALGVRVLGWKS